ncbi:glycoside hydrolase family 95-like protein [Saccharothrix hoggarensis]|uniref:Glycoside hydrolase family 95-like protein n=1 Tax=Saccharothrix hoggarensis TaxID=913853 RepID=A0ABW3QP67_9PSEU
MRCSLAFSPSNTGFDAVTLNGCCYRSLPTVPRDCRPGSPPATLRQGSIGAGDVLPPTWPTGSAAGLRGRGGYTVAGAWSGGWPSELSVTLDRDGLVKIRSRASTGAFDLRDETGGTLVQPERVEPDLVRFAGQAGHTYRVTSWARPPLVEPGLPYRLVAQHSGKRADVIGASTSPGTVLVHGHYRRRPHLAVDGHRQPKPALQAATRPTVRHRPWRGTNPLVRALIVTSPMSSTHSRHVAAAAGRSEVSWPDGVEPSSFAGGPSRRSGVDGWRTCAGRPDRRVSRAAGHHPGDRSVPPRLRVGGRADPPAHRPVGAAAR